MKPAQLLRITAFHSRIPFFIFIFLIFSSIAFAQKGTLKVFSELKGVNIYLDDEFKGTDVSTFDSVPAGSHYVKAVKDDVIVFGELVTVNVNQTTTLLIKDTKEVQDKLLAKKYKEQETYRSRKLDILQDTKLVTTTTGNTQINEKTKSLYFPGYYSVLGGSSTSGNVATNSTTVTKTETSWFIIRGNQKIDFKEFALLTNNTLYFDNLNDFQSKLAEYEVLKKQKPKWKVDWTPVFVGGVFIGLGALFYDPAVNPFDEETPTGKQLVKVLCVSSILTGTVAFFAGLFNHVKPNPAYPTFINPITMDTAIRDAKEYNRKLKIELGLPEDFEPQK